MIKQKKRFDAGELIFLEGEFGSCAYIIESGQVEIFVGPVDSSVCLATFGIGEIFGEMSVIDGSPRSASAKALEPCELIVISSEAISERIDDADPIVQFLISMLLQRMRLTNRAVGQETNLTEKEKIAPPALLSLESQEKKIQTEKVIEKMRVESELKHALVADEFTLHYQPIYELNVRGIAGFEALIRWNSPSRGLVRPDLFMGIAEETSLIVPIGRWVIERACQDLQRFRKHEALAGMGYQDIFISINISGRQFQDPHFFDHLVATVRNYGLCSSQIKLEVTERVLMEGPTALYYIKKCRDLGFHISLDDFGTGYSSLSYLAQFQVDSLKVDQSFIKKMLQDPKTFVITQSIISMANGLNIPVIAEGIENREEYLALTEEMFCRFGQGYWFSRPMPFQDILGLLEDSIQHDKVS